MLGIFHRSRICTVELSIKVLSYTSRWHLYSSKEQVDHRVPKPYKHIFVFEHDERPHISYISKPFAKADLVHVCFSVPVLLDFIWLTFVGL